MWAVKSEMDDDSRWAGAELVCDFDRHGENAWELVVQRDVDGRCAYRMWSEIPDSMKTMSTLLQYETHIPNDLLWDHKESKFGDLPTTVGLRGEFGWGRDKTKELLKKGRTRDDVEITTAVDYY